MKPAHHIAGLLLLLVTSACCSPQNKEEKAIQRPFPFVQVPSMMENDQKLEYLLSHYWDNLLDTNSIVSCDTTAISGVRLNDVEQAMANYAALLEQVELPVARIHVESLAKTLSGGYNQYSRGNVFNGLCAIFERYFYDPNSPLRDEDLYQPYAEVMAQCASLSPSRREALQGQANLSKLNQRGSKAADFSFTLRNGKKKTLYGVKAEYTLLFFSNPGCTACKEIIDNLKSMPDYEARLSSGSLAVVNIYIDEDVQQWREYSSLYPESWYNGFDHNLILRDDEIYNIRAIPSLYLLDADKRVILKDASTERVLGTLQNIFE